MNYTQYMLYMPLYSKIFKQGSPVKPRKQLAEALVLTSLGYFFNPMQIMSRHSRLEAEWSVGSGSTCCMHILRLKLGRCTGPGPLH